MAQKRAWETKRQKPPITYIGKICPLCKNIFFVPLSLKTVRFCSFLCYKKYWSIKSVGVGNHMYGVCGENAPNWMGGISFEPYPYQFNGNFKNKVRSIDQNTCQGCEQKQAKKLDVHHIDYNKNNIEIGNLVSLCKSCHMKTNFNRKCWEKYFRSRLNVA